MILYGDYHTHTVFSHGKGTVLENATVACRKGLKEIAITDHGFNHKCFALKRDKVDLLLKKIEEAKKETGINILYGVEANFISRDGTIDVTPEDYKKLDIVLCGFHNLVKTKTLKDKFDLSYKNVLASAFGSSQILKDKNTAMILRALEKNKID